MIEAEIIHPNIEKNKDRVTPATFNKNEVITVDTRGQIISSVPLTVTPITKRIGDKALIHLVEIPSGEFLMGVPEEGEVSNSSERPQHRVKILRFWMGQFLITQQQWQVVSSLPCIERALDNNPSYFKGPNLPVENVSWLDATEFCKRLSQATDTDYRLPSEAEWEYACRAGTTTPFYFGQTITAELANYNGTDSYESGPKNQYREQTTEVGSFPPNAFGLYDMHGNVWEWCQDTWHDNYTGAPTDGSAWTDNDNDSRIIRGGSWYNSPWYCRCVSRLRLNPGYRNFNYGFRVALVAPRTLQ
ncbi:MAG: formylglycine-generating enzyme family protein [Acaryochloris sp. RU_4_1]|nr:formylglycine-generating enzyme family protein [Acaryochloris sp. RU_4_1]NJR56685.1 formylglycine-generating enzyme family protein [Acaryochloris sp. CRU_2_0]